MSWYNYPQKKNGSKEDVLTPPRGRHLPDLKLEGFSQGGRGTTRIMFKYPGLFGSNEPEMHPGQPGLNPARSGSSPATMPGPSPENSPDEAKPPVCPSCYGSGPRDSTTSTTSSIPPISGSSDAPTAGRSGAPHSYRIIYEKQGVELMKFHQRNFASGK